MTEKSSSQLPMRKKVIIYSKFLFDSIIIVCLSCNSLLIHLIRVYIYLFVTYILRQKNKLELYWYICIIRVEVCIADFTFNVIYKMRTGDSIRVKQAIEILSYVYRSAKFDGKFFNFFARLFILLSVRNVSYIDKW